MNTELIREFVEAVPNAQADALLANLTRSAMIEKLTQKRAEGKHGWYSRECTNTELIQSLREHVEKGDMIDVINLAAMIMIRNELFGGDA